MRHRRSFSLCLGKLSFEGTGDELTLKNDQNQPQVAKSEKRLLPILKLDIPDGHAVDKTDDYLPDQTCPDDLVCEPFGKGKEDEE